jgi:hypothetical protein
MSVFGVFYPGQIGHCQLYNSILPCFYMGVPLNVNNQCGQGSIQRREQIHLGC